ncbi:MAG TPA: hypothetical protein VFS00_25120 [Polyangiaceae bacterium]|nr:hypothetical protein [Polyangiaceae bacterium]
MATAPRPDDAPPAGGEVRVVVTKAWRWALVAPVALALLTFVIQARLAGGPAAARADAAETALAFAAAGAGCLAAALAFASGDYMRRAWGFMSACDLLLMLKPLLFGSDGRYFPRSPASPAALASGAITVAANLSFLIGMVLVGRAWKVAGLDLRVSRRVRLGASFASIAFALLVAGGGAWQSARSLAGGRLASLSPLASAAGDIASLAVLAPIVLTALALRGGALAWPWAALALSTLGWLLFDSLGATTQFFDVAIPFEHPLQEALRVFACACAFVAGLLQRAVLRRAEGP